MFKTIKKLILLAVILVIGFVALAITDGGKYFRWFGNKVQQKTTELGHTADLIKDASEDIKNATRSIKETGKIVKGLAKDTAETAGKIAEMASKAGRAVSNYNGPGSGLIKNDKERKVPKVIEAEKKK